MIRITRRYRTFPPLEVPSSNILSGCMLPNSKPDLTQTPGLLMKPEHNETKAKAETRECKTKTETETETKKLL